MPAKLLDLAMSVALDACLLSALTIDSALLRSSPSMRTAAAEPGMDLERLKISLDLSTDEDFLVETSCLTGAC